MKDELSGLLSSKEIKSRIKAFLETKANDEVCALFMIDVDNFREIHDTLGEKTGEECFNRQLHRYFRRYMRNSFRRIVLVFDQTEVHTMH